MIRRYARIAAILHIAYALFWLSMSPHSRLVAERYAVVTMAVMATLFYLILIVAFWEAAKTRLNVALAVQKFFWFLLIGVVALPGFLGVVVHDAPYRPVGNPYALWTVPSWLRVYIWLGITVSLLGVLYEFWRVNWGPPTKVFEDRRKRPYGRRATDRPPAIEETA